MSNWEIWLDDPFGNRLLQLDRTEGFSLTRIVNNIGAFVLNLPWDFDSKLIKLDGLVEFWRSPEGGALKWVGTGMVRRHKFHDDNGKDVLTLGGVDAIDLLRRRIVAYAADSTGSLQTDNADDIMKAIVKQNLGANAVAARNLTALGFTVDVDLHAAPSITMGFSWKNVLEVLQNLANASAQNGVELFFDLIPVLITSTQIGFNFRTFTGQPGKNHTYPNGINPVQFGKEWGNLGAAELEIDYGEEINYVYVGGDGEDEARTIVELSDPTRVGASPYNRCETFTDARNNSGSSLYSKGNNELIAGNPKRRFQGELLDTEQTRYGINWEFGDKVSATYLGNQFNGIIRGVSFSVNSDGVESLSAKMENVV